MVRIYIGDELVLDWDTIGYLYKNKIINKYFKIHATNSSKKYVKQKEF